MGFIYQTGAGSSRHLVGIANANVGCETDTTGSTARTSQLSTPIGDGDIGGDDCGESDVKELAPEVAVAVAAAIAAGGPGGCLSPIAADSSTRQDITKSSTVRGRAGGDGGGESEGTPEAHRPNDEGGAGAEERLHRRKVGLNRGALGRDPADGERGGHDPDDHLGDHGRQRRCADSVTEAGDENELDDDVDRGSSDGERERRGRVLSTVERPVRSEGDQQEREAEERDVEVGLGRHELCAVSAEPSEKRRAE